LLISTSTFIGRSDHFEADHLIEAGSLRRDCAKNNTRLHDYYRQLGFALWTIDLPRRKSGALFQRPALHANED
jgi:hypothetical protein